MRSGAGVLLTLTAAAITSISARGATPAAIQNAVPSPMAQDSSPYWFGVAVEKLPTAIAEQLKLLPDQGVIVTTVYAGSPAEKAGIKPGDLLVELNGKPLLSRDELGKAANLVVPTKAGPANGSPTMQASAIVYLRKGDRHAVSVSPDRRPADIPAGENSGNFSNNAVARLTNNYNNDRQQVVSNSSGANQARSYLLPNGNNVQVGPGYQIDANSQHNLQIVRQALNNGQSITMTQDKDAAGNIKNTINDGKNTYVVEPGNIDQLPENFRPLAQQMLNPSQNPAANSVGQASNFANNQRINAISADERLNRLEKQNEELKAQIAELKVLLLKANTAPAAAGIPIPAGR
jgi:hypothetical protein